MESVRSPSAAPRRARLAGALVAALLVVAALLSGTPAAAQGSRVADVALGFGGELVGGAWNPLTVTLRDVPDATLEITFDQGSLRDGTVPVVYRAALEGGGGLHLFEDDVWVPAWRSLVWTVASGERVWGSGSLGARERDERPLQLLLTSDPGRYRDAYAAEARLGEVTAADLPERAAAYDGVATLLVDGSAAAPRLDAVAAAAAAGVTVVLVEPLPPSHRDLALVAPGADNPLGAGRVLRSAARDLPQALARRGDVDPDALRERLAEELSVPSPPLPPIEIATAALAAYALATLLLLRFGRLPGALAALALAALLSAAGWRALRPERTSFRADAALELTASGLALRSVTSEILTLPAGTAELDRVARGAPDRPFTLSPDGVRYPVQRWSRDRFELRPVLAPPALSLAGGELRAPRGAVLEPFVVGRGALPDLPAGGAAPLPAASPAGDAADGVPRAYRAIAGALPAGAALGTAPDGTVLVALPPRDPGPVPAPAPLERRGPSDASGERGDDVPDDASDAPTASGAPGGDPGAAPGAVRNPFALPPGAADESAPPDAPEGTP